MYSLFSMVMLVSCKILKWTTGSAKEFHGDYNQSSNFVEFLNKLANGTVVAIAVYDEATSSLSSAAFKAIESLGSEKIRQLQYRGSWAFIGVKGHPQKKVESLSNTSDAEAKFWIPVLGFDSITEDAGGFLVKAESAGKEVGNYAAISGQLFAPHVQ